MVPNSHTAYNICTEVADFGCKGHSIRLLLAQAFRDGFEKLCCLSRFGRGNLGNQ
jgi:hypothetical protein